MIEHADDAAVDRLSHDEAPTWACFPTARNEREWRKLAPPSLVPCADCLPDYQAQMIREGRCRHPGAVFAVVDGEVVGRIRGRFGSSQYAFRTAADPRVSRLSLQLAEELFGREAAAALLGLRESSMPAYRNGGRLLPVAKLTALHHAIRAAARLIAARS